MQILKQVYIVNNNHFPDILIENSLKICQNDLISYVYNKEYTYQDVTRYAVSYCYGIEEYSVDVDYKSDIQVLNVIECSFIKINNIYYKTLYPHNDDSIIDFAHNLDFAYKKIVCLDKNEVLLTLSKIKCKKLNALDLEFKDLIIKLDSI
jgi:hypothetical protein